MGGLLFADPGEHQAQERADEEHRAAVGREGGTTASREVGAVGDVGEVDDEEAAHVRIVASGAQPRARQDRDSDNLVWLCWRLHPPRRGSRKGSAHGCEGGT